MLSGSQRVALLGALHEADQAEVAERLRVHWEIDEDKVTAKRARDFVPKTAVQELAVKLSECPHLAVHFAKVEARDVFADDMLAQVKIEGLVFGKSTDGAALPSAIREMWLHACHDRYVAKLAGHDASDPFADAESYDAFRKWHAEGARLRQVLARVRRELAQVRGIE